MWGHPPTLWLRGAHSMSTYGRRRDQNINYRRIYEQHFGSIPVDEQGRKYEIHHIDGDHTNNDPSNLTAINIAEHYKIHYNQGDWYACYLIAIRMKLSPNTISRLSSLTQLRRIAEGNHPFLDIESKRASVLKRVADGTHNLLGSRNPVHRLVAEGKHHLQGGDIQRRNNQKRITEGTHNFLDSEFQRNIALQRIANGTHNFINNHPTKILIECQHCNKTGPMPQMKRWHLDNCKHKICD